MVWSLVSGAYKMGRKDEKEPIMLFQNLVGEVAFHAEGK